MGSLQHKVAFFHLIHCLISHHSLSAMRELTFTPGPKVPGPMQYHDYAQPPPEDILEQHSATAGCQTEVTMEDILLRAEQLEGNDPVPGQSATMPDIVDWATETDERVNFYTGIKSKNLLNGKQFTLDPTNTHAHLILGPCHDND